MKKNAVSQKILKGHRLIVLWGKKNITNTKKCQEALSKTEEKIARLKTSIQAYRHKIHIQNK